MRTNCIQSLIAIDKRSYVRDNSMCCETKVMEYDRGRPPGQVCRCIELTSLETVSATSRMPRDDRRTTSGERIGEECRREFDIPKQSNTRRVDAADPKVTPWSLPQNYDGPQDRDPNDAVGTRERAWTCSAGEKSHFHFRIR